MLKRSLRACVIFAIAVCSLRSAGFSQDPPPQTPPAKEEVKLETNEDKASYAIGFNIGNDLKRQGLDLDAQKIAAGIAAALAGQESALTEAEIQEAFAAMRANVQKKMAEKSKANLEAGKKFLEANKAKEGVKTTESGLQYLVVKEGSGAKPTRSSSVKTHYRGTLINGNVFDQSYTGDAPTDKDEPVQFGVTQVIKGWTEALQLMKAGSHYRLFIPSDLAYGPDGPGDIGPNSVLIFEIHLLEVE